MPSSVIRRLGASIASRELRGLARPSIVGKPPHVMLTPASPEFGAVSDVIAMRGAIPTSSVWFSANDPIAVPFTLGETETVYQLGWWNGAGTLSDSVDIGVYDTAWSRKVAGGGTARSGVSTLQFVNVTDTVLAPGKYYLVQSNNGVTAGNAFQWDGLGTALTWALMGALDSATDAYPLPSTLTNMAAAATAIRLPVGIIALRSLV